MVVRMGSNYVGSTAPGGPDVIEGGMGKLMQIRKIEMDANTSLDQAADALEVITNCNYLICDEAHNPEAVRGFANDSECAVKKLAEALQSLGIVRRRFDPAA